MPMISCLLSSHGVAYIHGVAVAAIFVVYNHTSLPSGTICRAECFV